MPLDDFNRADGVLGANWTYPLDTNLFSDTPAIISNKVGFAGTFAFFGAGATWNALSFADGKSICTIGAGSSVNASVIIRYNPTGSSFSGYYFNVSPSAWSLIGDDIAGSSHLLLFATGSRTFTAGDRIKITGFGSKIRAWHSTGSGWSLVTSITDTTFSSAGKIGFFIGLDGSQVTIDDFDGGAGAEYTVVNGTQSSITLTSGDIVSALSRKQNLLLTSAELAAFLGTAGTAAYREPAQAAIQTRRKTLMLAAHRPSS